jgi:hypothetical protein
MFALSLLLIVAGGPSGPEAPPFTVAQPAPQLDSAALVVPAADLAAAALGAMESWSRAHDVELALESEVQGLRLPAGDAPLLVARPAASRLVPGRR